MPGGEVDDCFPRAGGHGVILDGGGTLGMAFLLKANNVEIQGFTIPNYDMVLGNRTLANRRSGVADNAGLNLIRGNLLVGNRIAGIHEVDGRGSAGIIDNMVSSNQGDGLHLDTGGRTVAGNEVRDNTLVVPGLTAMAISWTKTGLAGTTPAASGSRRPAT